MQRVFLLLVSLAILAANLPVTPASAGRLAVHVSGNRLADDNGRTVRLLGGARDATEFACDQGHAPYGWSIFASAPPSPAQVSVMVNEWHMTALRIPLNEDCWLGINNVNPLYGGAIYRAAIATEINLLNQQGMFAVLDLHWTAPSTLPAQAQQAMADADHSIDFWRSIATTFRSNPAVVFELFNEPYIANWNATGNPWACWRDGCRMTQVNPASNSHYAYTWQSAGVQQMIDAIRSTGASQPILANGLNWADDMSGWLSHRPVDPLHQLGAAWHVYPGELCALSACWQSSVLPIVQAGYPVVITEFGDRGGSYANCGHTFIDPLMAWADSHGLAGYLAWAYFPYASLTSCGPRNLGLILNWSGTPSPYGIGLRDHLTALWQNQGQATQVTTPTASGAVARAVVVPGRANPLGLLAPNRATLVPAVAGASPASPGSPLYGIAGLLLLTGLITLALVLHGRRRMARP